MSKNVIDHQSLFDQMPITRLLLELKGTHFFVRDVNKHGLAYFNLDKEKMVGHPLKKLIPQATYDRMLASLNTSYEKKLSVTIPSLATTEKELPSFWVNPVLGENSDVLFLDLMAQPSATNVSVVERERDDALSLLTAIFDASDVAILVSDSKRHIVKVNNSFERLYGWSQDKTIGNDFLNFVIEDEHKIAQNSYEEFLKHDQSYSGEVKIFCKNGTVASTMFTSASLKLSHRRRFQVTALVDITKREQMELSLRLSKDRADAANNAKSVFLANMSHELRTPLNAIIGFSEIMVNESFGPIENKKYQEYLSDVHLSAKHLLGIINEVLDMSKIEAGKIELEEQEIDLNGLMKTLTRIMSSRAVNEYISIKEIYQEDLPKLYADSRLIRQVIINLITNSIKHSVNGGNITVKTRLSSKNEIEIVIDDQGIGIPKDRIKDAMEPFGQIHDPSTHSEVYQGTGLGLPLAKAMVEMHGGVFTLESEEGEGTTVTISFSTSRTRPH